MADNYTPTPEVIAAHNIPPTLHLDKSQDYLEGVGSFPVAFVLLGLSSLVVYHIIFYYLHGFRQVDKKKLLSRVGKYYSKSHVIFRILLVVVGLSCSLVFLGNHGLNDILRDTADALSYYSNRLKNSEVTSSSIAFIANDIGNNYVNNSMMPCNEVMINMGVYNDYYYNASYARDSAVEMGNTNDVSSLLDYISYQISNAVIPDKDIEVYTLFALSVIFVLLTLRAYFKKSRKYFKVSLFIVELHVMALTIVAAVEMAVVHALGDLCIDPVNAVNKILGSSDPNSRLYNLIPYNIQCRGIDPVTPYYMTTMKYTTNLENLITTNGDAIYQEISAQGQDPTCVQKIHDKIVLMKSTLLNLQQYSGCEQSRQIFIESIENGLCRGGVNGFMTLWLVHLFTASFLYIALICGCYFFEYWFHNHDEEMDDSNAIADSDNKDFYSKTVFGFVYRSPRDMTPREDEESTPNKPKDTDIHIESNSFSETPRDAPRLSAERQAIRKSLQRRAERNSISMEDTGGGGSGSSPPPPPPLPPITASIRKSQERSHPIHHMLMNKFKHSHGNGDEVSLLDDESQPNLGPSQKGLNYVTSIHDRQKDKQELRDSLEYINAFDKTPVRSGDSATSTYTTNSQEDSPNSMSEEHMDSPINNATTSLPLTPSHVNPPPPPPPLQTSTSVDIHAPPPPNTLPHVPLLPPKPPLLIHSSQRPPHISDDQCNSDEDTVAVNMTSPNSHPNYHHHSHSHIKDSNDTSTTTSLIPIEEFFESVNNNNNNLTTTTSSSITNGIIPESKDEEDEDLLALQHTGLHIG